MRPEYSSSDKESTGRTDLIRYLERLTSVSSEAAYDRLAGGPFDPYGFAAEYGEEVLLVGHDPDFSAAVHSATGAQVRMRKGGVAGIAKGELAVLLRPAELGLIAATAPARSE